VGIERPEVLVEQLTAYLAAFRSCCALPKLSVDTVAGRYPING
jgi:hypothetical protein